MSEDDLHLLTVAYSFAAKKHSTQRRKNADQSPYINHPIRVACRVSWWFPMEKMQQIFGVHMAQGIKQDAIIAAVLHDTLEDTDTAQDEIMERFGPNVLRYVLEVSDDKSLPKADRKRLQVKHAKHSSDVAKVIKMADAYDNMLGLVGDEKPESWSEERIQGYLVWKWTVLSGCRGVSSAADRILDEFFDKHLTIPEEDRAEALEAYYQEMEKVND